MRRSSTSDDALSAEQREAALRGRKGMMPIRDREGRQRPFLDFSLGALAEAGYRDVVLVVAPDDTEVRAYYRGEGVPEHVCVEFAEQAEPRGTADAVLAAHQAVADREFIVINGDNLYPVSALEALRRVDGPGLVAFERATLVAAGRMPAERIAAFALLDVSPHGRLRDIVEKPTSEQLAAGGATALVSMNCWRFDSRIFDACRQTPPSVRGECELTTAVRLALDAGAEFIVGTSGEAVLDLTTRGDVGTLQALLGRIEPRP